MQLFERPRRQLQLNEDLEISAASEWRNFTISLSDFKRWVQIILNCQLVIVVRIIKVEQAWEGWLMIGITIRYSILRGDGDLG